MKIFYMHIAKTGGSSINEYFTRVLGEEKCQDHIQQPHITDEFVLSKEFISGHVAYSQAHAVYNLTNHYKITLLRHPITHLISHLNWIKKLSFEKYKAHYDQHDTNIKELVDLIKNYDLNNLNEIQSFLENMTDHGKKLFYNAQGRYFLSERFHGQLFKKGMLNEALENFNKFDYVGQTESLDHFLQNVSSQLKLPNIQVNKVNENNEYNKKFTFDIEVALEKLIDYVYIDLILWQKTAEKFSKFK